MAFVSFILEYFVYPQKRLTVTMAQAFPLLELELSLLLIIIRV